MRVLQVGKFYYPVVGGVETVEYDLTEMLNRNNITCDVLCTDIGKVNRTDIINGYRVYRSATITSIFSTSLSYSYIKNLRSLIKDYDIIHVHLPNPLANFSLLFANMHGKKIVLHWHSDIIKQKFLLKLYRPLQSWLLKKADVIIGTSDKYIAESHELKPYLDKCVSIPIGIDCEHLEYDGELVEKIKSQYHYKKIIFSLGRHVYYKGFEHLIAAAKYLSDDYVVVIGGDGPLRKELQIKIESLNLQDKVFLVGKIKNNELGSYFSACKVFCLPSILKSEAFGVVQIEAMSYSKPVVATNIKGSGTSWVNMHGVSGLNVEIENPEQIAAAIRDIADDDNVYAKYSVDAKRRFDILFKREVMYEKTKVLYQSLFQ